MTSALDGFTRFEFDDGRWTREVWKIGTGPAVIVIHEIPGLHPGVLAFARDVAAAGMTVFCPSLFGEPAKPVSTGYALGVIAKTLCVRREFTAWATRCAGGSQRNGCRRGWKPQRSRTPRRARRSCAGSVR